jgi:hypothetical protein
MNPRGICAYCGSFVALTKEELFPKFMASKVHFNTFVDRRRGQRPLSKPPTVVDVCRVCNNVTLSALDRYVSSLFKRYFLLPVRAPVLVNFDYEYDLLLRWLLKVMYNFARKERDRLECFRQLVPYILGSTSAPNRQFLVLLGVLEASAAEPHEVTAGLPENFSPMFHNLGQIALRNVQWPKFFTSLRYGLGVASYFL